MYTIDKDCGICSNLVLILSILQLFFAIIAKKNLNVQQQKRVQEWVKMHYFCTKNKLQAIWKLGKWIELMFKVTNQILVT